MSVFAWLKNEENLVVLRALQSLLTMLATVASGIWTYLLFVKRQQRYPTIPGPHPMILQGTTCNGMCALRIPDFARTWSRFSS